jgi:putative heme transporter
MPPLGGDEKGGLTEPEGTQAHPRSNMRRVLQGVLSLALVVAIFAFALPRLADFSEVWAELAEMTWIEFLTLVVASLWNIVTYWFVMVAALPGLTLYQAMLVNQSSTAIANTLPGGGAIGVGVTYAMYTSFRFSPSQIALSVAVSGVWNNFVKLGMPVIAIALLALEGDAAGTTLTAAVIGVGVLVGAVVAFAAVLRSEHVAFVVGDKLGGAMSAVGRIVRRGPFDGWGDKAVRFRSETIELLERRWLWLTLATLVSHLSLYVVLLVTLRHVGVSEDEVSWIQVLAAFSFMRLVSALPITPGGLGVVELGYSAALIAAGGDRAQVVASVLLFRALTYLLPIPLGALTYVLWRRGAHRGEHPGAPAEALAGGKPGR